jgi:inorganic pyrophosphatase
MKVFIENEAGSNQKNIFNEKTLEFRKTVEVSRKYPFPYGFILDTTSGDGDNLDCFVITDRVLKMGDVVESEPIGIMEQFEDTIEDHNVLARLSDELPEVTAENEETLTEFVLHVFDHRPHHPKVRVGRFLGAEEAKKYISKTLD